MTISVADAVAAVDYDHFVIEPDGTRLAQSSSIASIQQMLHDLDVRPGDRVLEIGTGSGYTTALLAHLVGAGVGAGGTVRSVEVFADLVPRARARLTAAGVTGVTVTEGDGYAGDPAGAPYDRVVAWAAPHVVPSAWIDQIIESAVIVAPVKVAPLAAANAIAAVTVTGGRPTAVRARRGGYIEMHPEPVTVFGLPLRYVDASYVAADGAVPDDTGVSANTEVPDDTEVLGNTEPWWLSSPGLRAVPGAAGRVLERLRDASVASATSLTEAESHDDFTAWLLATLPEGLATAGLSARFSAIGAVVDDGAALLTRDELVAAGNADALRTLDTWIVRWREAGRPGWSDVGAVVVPTVEGWEVRLTLQEA